VKKRGWESGKLTMKIIDSFQAILRSSQQSSTGLRAARGHCSIDIREKREDQREKREKLEERS
jgi:hypothetical protein